MLTSKLRLKKEWRENCYRSTSEGVLMAHTDGCWVWDCCIVVPPNSTGMWGRWELSVVVAQWLEHWRLKPATWVRFPVTFLVSFPHSFFSLSLEVNIFLIIIMLKIQLAHSLVLGPSEFNYPTCMHKGKSNWLCCCLCRWCRGHRNSQNLKI